MEIDPADTGLIPFYDRLHQHRIPLLTHTGRERSFTTSRDELADPMRLRLALERGVVVIAAHAGAAGKTDGESDLDRLRRLMTEFPNLHADISALTQVNRIGALRETLSAQECRGRLVYGSDFPLINTALVSPWYFPLNLTERQRREIENLSNPWDRDVKLKQALGVPAEIFLRSEQILRQSKEQR
jgi:predicted TIM-barrel fold metal-dependent hydrolase